MARVIPVKQLEVIEVPAEVSPPSIDREIISLIGRHAVAVEPDEYETLQKRLEESGTDLAKLATALESYKQGAEQSVGRLRSELRRACGQLQSTVNSVTNQSEDTGRAMSGHVRRVSDLKELQSLEEMRGGLAQLSQGLSDTAASIQSQNRLVVQQLAAEIQSLRKQLEAAEKKGATAGTLAHREAFEEQVRLWIERGDRFAVIILRVSNWRKLMDRLTRTGASRLTDKVVARAQAILGAECFAGRWFDGYAAAIIPFDRRTGVDRFDEIRNAVGGAYSLHEPEANLELTVQVRIWFIEHAAGQTAEHMLWRVDQLVRSFNKA